MLLQALSDLQADNAALTKALSDQSQEIKALRDSADQHTVKQDSAPEQEEESKLEAAQEDTSGEAAKETAAVEDAAREEAPPKDRTEARYRSLELKVQRLKAERDQMEKALRREVGDDTPLTKLLEGDSSDWRGRAQQIALLKERIISLHEAHAKAMGTPSNARNRHDVSNRANLERLRGGRMKEADDLRAELASTRAALEEAVSRQQGAAARKKALEKEVRSLKAKVGLLLDKSATDDSLIAALRSPAARSGAYATSQQAMQLPNQAMANQAWEAGSPAAFPAAGGALTGPVAADRGDQLAAAESASIQRTSFSISLDINTNLVSIQGSVTSPKLADRSVGFTNGAGNSNENSNVSKRVGMGTPLGSSMVEETEEAPQQATEVEGCKETAVHDEFTDEGQGDAAADGDEAVEAEGGVGIDADAPVDRENNCHEAAEGIADKESHVTGTNTAGVQEIEQEASLVTAEEEAAEVGVLNAADYNAELTTNKDATAEEDTSAQQLGEHSVDGANEEKVMVQAADGAAEPIEGAAEKLESPTAMNALHEAVDTVIAEMQVSAVAAESIA
ncbi:hypothetical protein COCSUDRAFT_57244 [Coccomyxa subellipsoidea C-169]|uniref:Uncharacterized protein n=1 Tax=Coccomyxa subellipsoidea (strain C-169) TaxID=574566 RepID=I0YQK7_COCSC|nr:hypothetical protein COCSUDRAFT_57244 [Coccomyxa subellipsoidea C-169]EIE20676.1 hypothetical protein COCSUDRAFT_57244 [Coccomyxa subellipsoidea C-169]|eukprot:XP_005645220.1 hypothetical protein COCSUDRAFT_57244 [Coccomyxa subellipsoidea C-169]